MNATFNTVIFYPMSYNNVNIYLQSSSIIVATGYFLGKSFSIQADYTQLKKYSYLLCDVSASTIIPVDISIPTANINLTPVSSFNYISDLYDTQVNQFYIINQPINYDMITSITFNVSSLAIFSNTQYTPITIYSNTSITLYSASSITIYSSSTFFTSITLYSYSSITLYSYSSDTLYSSSTVYSSITLYSYSSITLYSYSSITYYSSSTSFTSITLYSYSSSTIYSYSSVTNYSSSISYTSITLYSYTSSTIYSYNSITNYSSSTIYSSITLYNYSSNTLYSYSSITYYSSSTSYTSITLYSYTSLTVYSYSSITYYSSSTSYTSLTLYSYSSSTIYSYTSITSYTSTTVYAYSSSTIYSSSTVYSSITVYSGTGLQPIILSYTGNITSWSTTYSLTYNQTMIISFTNSQTIFVPLQLTGNDNYDLILSQDISAYNSGGTGAPVYLYPNNSSVTAIYSEFYVGYNGGSVGTGSGDHQYSAIRLTAVLGSTDITIINNSPFTKTVICKDVQVGTSYDPAAHFPAQIWNDYTTSWTMLGTITLPQTASGYVKITRIG